MQQHANRRVRITQLCPQCGSNLEKHRGVIDEPVITGHGKIERRARPATFLACNTCEHCEEYSAKETVH